MSVLCAYAQNNLFHSTLTEKKITNTRACDTNASTHHCAIGTYSSKLCLLTKERQGCDMCVYIFVYFYQHVSNTKTCPSCVHTHRIIFFTLRFTEKRSQTHMLVTLSHCYGTVTCWVQSLHNYSTVFTFLRDKAVICLYKTLKYSSLPTTGSLIQRHVGPAFIRT
jgi:hypothetical protein